jgi:repressor LexA
LDGEVTPTPLQRAYLDFIRDYMAVHREAPAETDMQKFFGTSPPAVHRMVVALAEKGPVSKDEIK